MWAADLLRIYYNYQRTIAQIVEFVEKKKATQSFLMVLVFLLDIANPLLSVFEGDCLRW